MSVTSIAGSRDDVGETVVVDVAGGHANAPLKSRAVSKEASDFRIRDAIENFDVRSNARIDARDDVGPVIVIDIAGADKHATEIAGAVGEEAANFCPGVAVEDLHMAAARSAG